MRGTHDGITAAFGLTRGRGRWQPRRAPRCQTPPKGRSTPTPAAASRERAEGVGAGPRRQATRPPKGREGGRGDLSSDSVPEPQCCGFVSDARFSEGDFDPRAWLIRPAAQTRNAGVTLMPRQGRGPGSPCTQRCVGRLLAVPGAVTSWRWGALLVTCALPAPVLSLHHTERLTGPPSRSGSGLAGGHVGAGSPARGPCARR